MRFFFLAETSCCFILSIINLALNSAILLCSGRFIFMFIEKSHLLLLSIFRNWYLYDLSSFRSCVLLFLYLFKYKFATKNRSYILASIFKKLLLLFSYALSILLPIFRYCFYQSFSFRNTSFFSF